MNTKDVTDKLERKKLKRAARKKAAPKAEARRRCGARIDEEEDPAPGAGPAQAVEPNETGAATVSHLPRPRASMH